MVSFWPFPFASADSVFSLPVSGSYVAAGRSPDGPLQAVVRMATIAIALGRVCTGRSFAL